MRTAYTTSASAKRGSRIARARGPTVRSGAGAPSFAITRDVDASNDGVRSGAYRIRNSALWALTGQNLVRALTIEESGESQHLIVAAHTASSTGGSRGKIIPRIAPTYATSFPSLSFIAGKDFGPEHPVGPSITTKQRHQCTSDVGEPRHHTRQASDWLACPIDARVRRDPEHRDATDHTPALSSHRRAAAEAQGRFVSTVSDQPRPTSQATR